MKLKERLVIGVMAGLVVMTVVLVLDVETGITMGGRPRTPTHARVQYSFRQRHLQKTNNGSREASLAAVASAQLNAAVEGPDNLVAVGSKGRREGNVTSAAPSDRYDDLMEAVLKIHNVSKASRKSRKHWNPTLKELLSVDLRDNATLWDKFHLSISRDELYAADDPAINKLLEQVKTLQINHITQKEGGTQLKLLIEFSNGGHALFKPMRFPREQQTMKNHFYFTDYERHNAEIAAFHLDRLLGFRRAAPVAGRTVNMTRELYALAQGDLLKTFFISPDGNLCFHGKCSYYCDTGHAICGNPDLLEGSFAVFLPAKELAPRKVWRHPWRRSYHKRRKAQWELDDDYCQLVKEVHPYNEGRRLLDIMDMSILDFLIGNMDRHHYETFKVFGNRTAPIHLDNGRGFGKPFHDEVSILAPLYQCCQIRHSTLSTLLRFHSGPMHLSEAMRVSMSVDAAAPVLWEPHLVALDRRLSIILQTVRECVDKTMDPMAVIVNDHH
ncbi:extracellular serine/threonine protein CG31145-like [Penaeus indicus]|uniref:extracellular serine/threonine protein CG31145-like n=1 Tax=Penaeus indicus TaxID=29960 RepID=UPI00300C4B4C